MLLAGNPVGRVPPVCVSPCRPPCSPFFAPLNGMPSNDRREGGEEGNWGEAVWSLHRHLSGCFALQLVVVVVGGGGGGGGV